MKIWIKLLIGSLIGLAVGLFHPRAGAGLLRFAHEPPRSGIGRYALFPFIFFSLGIGTSELRQEKRLGRVYLSLFKYLVLSAALLIIIGTLSVLVFPPERIPITVEADKRLHPGERDRRPEGDLPREPLRRLLRKRRFPSSRRWCWRSSSA